MGPYPYDGCNVQWRTCLIPAVYEREHKHRFEKELLFRNRLRNKIPLPNSGAMRLCGALEGGGDGQRVEEPVLGRAENSPQGPGEFVPHCFCIASG